MGRPGREVIEEAAAEICHRVCRPERLRRRSSAQAAFESLDSTPSVSVLSPAGRLSTGVPAGSMPSPTRSPRTNLRRREGDGDLQRLRARTPPRDCLAQESIRPFDDQAAFFRQGITLGGARNAGSYDPPRQRHSKPVTSVIDDVVWPWFLRLIRARLAIFGWRQRI